MRLSNDFTYFKYMTQITFAFEVREEPYFAYRLRIPTQHTTKLA